MSGQVYFDQAWSGDIMYAVRPNSSQFMPMDYFVPKQGSNRWIDAAVIGRASEKLWLAHELINYIHDPLVQAQISSWNLYATPNAWSFELLHQDSTYSYQGRLPDGGPYTWNPAEDSRIYADMAYGYAGPPILVLCEYERDMGATLATYLRYWTQVKG